MADYFVYGGCLRSELEFPELAPAHGHTPNWTLRLGTLSRDDGAEVLSDVQLSPRCRIRLTRGDGWFRYSHSCTGSFEIFAGGRRILFEPASNGDLNAARADFVSRVLLYCVDHTSIAWLHGSSVGIGGRAVGFLGRSGSGKSTIALALARAGCTHICDDTLPVDTATREVIASTDDVIRLRPDSKTNLASAFHAVRRESDGKFVMTRRSVHARQSMGSDKSENMRYPLDAIYVLNSGETIEASIAGLRRLISPTAALAVLIKHVKLGLVIQREDPARLMSQLGAVVQSIPVYELTVPHDWSVVDKVVDRITSWHASPIPQQQLISA